jgi:hypothetical protein
LSAFVDISLEMGHPGGDPETRRRCLYGFSRFKETPRRLLIELNPDGTDYAVVPEDNDDDFRGSWEVLRMVLESAKFKLTRREILADWPPDFVKPVESTLWKWLQRAGDLGLIHSQGTGRKNDPFRYWLPGQEEKWKDDPIAGYYLAREQVLADLDKADQASRARAQKKEAA